jgi:cytochrome c oxidase assembly factor CtaG
VKVLLPDPAALALLVPAALALVLCARQRRRWPAWRTRAGLAGLATLALASTAWFDERSSALLSIHMLQHALVQLVAAPLLVAAAPVRLTLGALAPPARRRLIRLLHRPLPRMLSHPLAGTTIFVVVLALVHVPAVYELALRHPWLHAAEHAALLWSAIALWAPIIGADPLPHRAGAIGRVGALIAAMTAMSALGAILATLPSLAYPSYAGATSALSRDPLRDQALAGGIMWVGSMVVVLPALLWLAWSALWAEECAQRVRESSLGGPREREAAASRR